MKCPICGKEMNEIKVKGSDDVHIDICDEHGIWFDKGELWEALKSVRKDRIKERGNFSKKHLKNKKSPIRNPRSTGVSIRVMGGSGRLGGSS